MTNHNDKRQNIQTQDEEHSNTVLSMILDIYYEEHSNTVLSMILDIYYDFRNQ